MDALPEGISADHKYFMGCYREETLCAVLDLIEGYPDEKTAFIGLFMVDAGYRNQGFGSERIQELLSFLGKNGFERCKLVWIKGNPQAEHFWKKNGFVPEMESFASSVNKTVIAAGCDLTRKAMEGCIEKQI